MNRGLDEGWSVSRMYLWNEHRTGRGLISEQDVSLPRCNPCRTACEGKWVYWHCLLVYVSCIEQSQRCSFCIAILSVVHDRNVPEVHTSRGSTGHASLNILKIKILQNGIPYSSLSSFKLKVTGNRLVMRTTCKPLRVFLDLSVVDLNSCTEYQRNELRWPEIVAKAKKGWEWDLNGRALIWSSKDGMAQCYGSYEIFTNLFEVHNHFGHVAECCVHLWKQSLFLMPELFIKVSNHWPHKGLCRCLWVGARACCRSKHLNRGSNKYENIGKTTRTWKKKENKMRTRRSTWNTIYKEEE